MFAIKHRLRFVWSANLYILFEFIPDRAIKLMKLGLKTWWTVGQLEGWTGRGNTFFVHTVSGDSFSGALGSSFELLVRLHWLWDGYGLLVTKKQQNWCFSTVWFCSVLPGCLSCDMNCLHGPHLGSSLSDPLPGWSLPQLFLFHPLTVPNYVWNWWSSAPIC